MAVRCGGLYWAEGSKETIKNLTGLKMDPEILALVTSTRICKTNGISRYHGIGHTTNKGLALLASNQAIFDKLEKTYGVNRYLLTAIWGMETNYGSYQGNKHVLRALATLGYDGGRRRGIRSPATHCCLKIIEAGDILSDKMFGSWAGAMGQTQFIPTTYLDYAVDATGDGKRDIWNSREDALGSALTI